MHTNKRLWTWLAALVMLVGVLAPAVYAEDSTHVADSSTLAQWQGTIDQSSKNVGRIWTDKTVQTGNVELKSTDGTQTLTVQMSENADFMVGLSALSSASTLATSQSQPLDVVLVLDTSGSMAYDMGSYTYTEVYDPTGATWNTCYIKVNDQYKEVTWEVDSYWPTYEGHWDCDGQEVTPKTSADDTDPNHVQFYSRSNSRLAALKAAVNNLIDYTAGENAEITDTSKQHRIALVEYASSSNVLLDFTSNSTSLKDEISALNANGATRADYGMQSAQALINGEQGYSGARKGAKTVVIFFTDGVPTSGNSFESSVANGAVQAAKSLKDGGTLVYSVGIFPGADTTNPTNGTTRENQFMHAVSSNYPNATAYNNRGERAVDSDYYKATQDSEELNEIFESIIKDSIKPSSPTVTDSGSPQTSGYITFTDELGPYMEVKDFNSVVYAGEQITQKKVSQDKTAYTFSGKVEGNDIYGAADLSNLVITVQKSSNPEQGDIVTVKIPASLIPLRYYDIDSKDGAATMSISEAYPIRVFYSVGLKSDVLTADGGVDPSKVSEEYRNNNTDGNGNIQFYANKYTSGSEYGDAEAFFTPAETNPFYYYTEDTPLYTDKECQNPVKNFSTSGTYYYKNTYYVKQGDVANETFEGVEVSNVPSDYVQNDENGNYYVLKGKSRASRAEAYRELKVDNESSTNTYSLYPLWETADGVLRASVHLGNNGVMVAPLSTGKLTISKTVQAEEGLTAPDKDFTFTVTLQDAQGGALTGSYNYTKSDNTTGTIGNGGTLTLKAGQSVTIEGLPNGTKYSVTENTESGFTTAVTDDSGNITGGQTATATFTNTYSVSSTELDGAANLQVTKVLSGRAWQKDDAFTFTLNGKDTVTQQAITSGAVKLPSNASGLTIDNSTSEHKAAFGNITFTKPGTYKFTVKESKGSLGGVTYDTHEATITVTVSDNGDGTLTCTAVVDPADGGLTFTNTYAVSGEVKATLDGTKTLTGRDSLEGEKFEFTLEAVGDTANKVQNGDVVLPENCNASVENLTDGTATSFAFGEITFKKAGTYTFEVKEKIPSGVDPDTHVLNGVTYDTGTDTITVTVTDTDATGKQDGVLRADTVVHTHKDFTNSYVPEPVVYGDGSTLLGGHKTLNDTVGTYTMADGDFAFIMQPFSDGQPLPKAENGVSHITIQTEQGTKPVAVVCNSNSSANRAEYDFGEIEFTEAGTYQYYIREDANHVWEAGPGIQPGVSYDTKQYVVTFTVTENEAEGKLSVSAAATTTPGGVADMTKLDFTNTYSATEVSHATPITKNLDGRNFQAGDSFIFEATLQATNLDGQPMDYSELPQPKVTNSDRYTIQGPTQDGNTLKYNLAITPNVTDSGSWAFSTGEFTYTQAGTYTFTFKETTGNISGVTYDDTVYTLVVTITEDTSGGTPVLERTGTITSSKTGLVNTVTFTNTYAASGTLAGATNLQVTKELAGRDWQNDDVFTFKLEGYDDLTKNAIGSGTVELPANASSLEIDNTSNNHSATFGDITFHKVGTYKFAVSETVPTGAVDNKLNGVTYDSAAKIVTVAVADNGDGTLTAEVQNPVELTFTNTYQAAPTTVIITGHKNIVDKTIEPPTDTTSDEDPSTTVSEEEPGDTTSDEAPANTLPEEEPNETAPEEEPVNTEPEKESDDAMTDEAPADVVPDGEATEPASGEEPNETVTEEEPVESTVVEESVVTTAPAENRTTAVTTAAVRPVMATTSSRYTTGLRLVNMTDASTPSDTTEEEPAPVDSDIKPETLEEKPLNLDPSIKDTWEFTYEIIKDGETVPTVTATSKGANDFEFPAIEFSAVGEYTYTIREVSTGAEEYITYDTTVYTLKVKVEDDLKGNLVATYTITDGEGKDVPDKKPVFTNSYSANPIQVNVSADLNAKKVLTGRAQPLQDNEFTFQILDEKDDVVSTGTNDAEGNITFTPWYYTMEETGTHTYKVKEVANNPANGIKFDETVYTFTVTVTDDNQGELTATVQKAQDIVFNNTYTAADTEVELSAKKVLTGRTLGADEFQFSLQDMSGQEEIASNDADGNVTFAPITFTMADLGGKAEETFHYVVCELNNKATGVSYDQTVYDVFITVTDDGKGNLTAKTVYNANEKAVEEMVFVNNYQPLPLDYQVPQGIKTLNGRELKDGEFQFVVEKQDISDPANPWKWTQVSQGVNQGEDLVFDPVKITQAGNYTLRVREVNNNLPGVTYDTTVYYLTMTVYDDDGMLKARDVVITRGDMQTVGSDEAEIHFVNSYQESEGGSGNNPEPTPAPTTTPTPEQLPNQTPTQAAVTLPQTGDTMPVTALVVLAIAAAVLLVALIVLRKRRSK